MIAMVKAADAGSHARPAPRFESGAPYDDTADELMTGEAVAIDVRPAGFILRAAGAAIDWLVYIGLLIGILVLTQVTLAKVVDPAAMAAISVVALVFSIVIAPIAVEVATHGRSLGKLAVGARIVRDDGGAESLRHAFVRALIGVFEIYFTFGGLAALVALLSPRSKRLGDLLAGTYSQHERVASASAPPLGLPPALASWATIADVAKLPDQLARRIAQFLAQLTALTPTARAGLGAQLAAEAAPYVSPLPNADPVTFLVAVAAVRRERDGTALALEAGRLARLEPVLGGMPHGFPQR
jgi:Predicted membrane protein/domain